MQEKTLEEELKKISKELYGDEYKLGVNEYNVLYTALEKAREEGRKEKNTVESLYAFDAGVKTGITQYKEELLGKLETLKEKDFNMGMEEYEPVSDWSECLSLVKKLIKEYEMENIPHRHQNL